MPGRVYTKDELRSYLNHCRVKCRATVDALTGERAGAQCRFGWGELSFAELHLYNLRHVQHHAAQLNLILRQGIDSAPGWVARAGDGGG